MALYEYECPQCLEKFETMKTMEHRHYARCPHCNSKTPLVISGFSFRMGKQQEMYQGPRRRSERLM